MVNYRCIFIVLLLLSGCKDQQREPVIKSAGSVKYELVKDWPQLPPGYTLGNPTGIGIYSNQNIFVFHRAGRTWPLIMPMPGSFIKENTVLLLNRHNGKILNSWGSNIFIMPHGLTVDKYNNVWVTDVGLQQVLKFSHEGKLLMRLGEAKVKGTDTAHFNLPTDVAVAADGSFYVSDGYGNSRVIKFSASGKYLFEWGSKGSGAGEFNIPHGIDIDEDGNVYVADRENSRIQFFDSTGNFLKEIKNNGAGKLYSLALDNSKKYLITVDYLTNFMMQPKGSDILVFDSTGNQMAKFGRSGSYEGPACRYHDVAVDDEGSIYVGDILNNKIQKFKKVTAF